MIIVGSSVVFGKIITHSFPVFLASGLRFAIAALFLVPIVKIRGEKLLGLSKRDFFNLLFMAFSGQVVFTFLVLLGLRYTSAVEAGIITSTSPAWMAVVTWLFFREKPGMVQAAAIFMVVAGIIIVNGVFSLSGVGSDGNHILGNLLMVGAVVGEAFFLLMRKRISPRVSNLQLTAYLCILGFLMFLPLSIYQGISFDFKSVPAAAWLAMLYFGAVFTVLAYLFWFQGVSKVSGSVAGVFTAVMPVSAVVLSCIFLKEVFTGYHAIGGALIVLAILLMAVKPPAVKTSMADSSYVKK